MLVVRREFLALSGIPVLVPSLSVAALAQSPLAPKLTQILRKDLEGQGEIVQETVVNIAEFAAGSASPWHMHPSAQELLHVIEGNLVVEVEGQGTALMKAGDAAVIAADRAHLVRNDSTGISGKALVVYSRAAKDRPLVVPVAR